MRSGHDMSLLTSLVLMTSLFNPCLGYQEAPIFRVPCCTAQPSSRHAEMLNCICPDMDKLEIRAGNIPTSVQSIIISKVKNLTIFEDAVYDLHSLNSISLNDNGNVIIEQGGMKLHGKTSLSSFNATSSNLLSIDSEAFAGDWKDITFVILKDIKTLKIAPRAFNYTAGQPGPRFRMKNIPTFDVASEAFNAFVRQLDLDNVHMQECRRDTFNEKIDSIVLNGVVITELAKQCFHFDVDHKITDGLRRDVTIKASTLKAVRPQAFSGYITSLKLNQGTVLDTVYEDGFKLHVNEFMIIDSNIKTLHSRGLSITSDFTLSLRNVNITNLRKNAIAGIWMTSGPLNAVSIDGLKIQNAEDGSLSLPPCLPLDVSELFILAPLADMCPTERLARRLLGAVGCRLLRTANEVQVFLSLSRHHPCQEKNETTPERTDDDDDDESCIDLNDEERQGKEYLAPIYRISCCTAQPSCREAEKLNCTCPNREKLVIRAGDIPTSVKSIHISQVESLTIDKDAIHGLHSLTDFSLRGIGSVLIKKDGMKLHKNASLSLFSVIGANLLKIDSYAFAGDWQNTTSVILKDITTLQIATRAFSYTAVQRGPIIKMQNITTLDMDVGTFDAFVSQLRLDNVSMPQCQRSTFNANIYSLVLNSVAIPDLKMHCFQYNIGQKITEGLRRDVTIKSSALGTVQPKAFSGNITSLKLEDNTELNTVQESGFQVHVMDFIITKSKIVTLHSRGLIITSGSALSLRDVLVEHLHSNAFSGIGMISTPGRNHAVVFNGLKIQHAESGSLLLPACLPLDVSELHIQGSVAERCPTETLARRLLGADDHRPLRIAEYMVFESLSDRHYCEMKGETTPKRSDDDEGCDKNLQKKDDQKREKEDEMSLEKGASHDVEDNGLNEFHEQFEVPPDGRSADDNLAVEKCPEVEVSYKTAFFITLVLLILAIFVLFFEELRFLREKNIEKNVNNR